MNILISYEWLKDYVDLKESPEQFAARVSVSSVGVEKLYPQGEDLRGIVLGQIKTIDAHPDPKVTGLRIVSVDVGHKKHAAIVCGGSNLFVDSFVAVAVPGARVRWHGEGELVELQPTVIRGVQSDGMICAANEIGLFDAFPHAEKEILVLDDVIAEISNTGKKKRVIKPGLPLADVLGLSQDIVMDIEVTTNRPDAFSLVGLAREAATILQRPFLWKDRVLSDAAQTLPALSVSVKEKKICPRAMFIRVDGVKVGHSPWWLKRRLLSAGQRPINNLVDITNYVMLELGRPMHVFDADKLQGELTVRRAKDGESLEALDGKTYQLSDKHIVVADENGPQSIAGIMGGEHSAVTRDTTSVIFECATWDPVVIRRMSHDLNLTSDAQRLFEKGLSTESCPQGLARSIELCLQLAGGEVASRVTDECVEPYVAKKYTLSSDEASMLIGIPFKARDMAKTLTRLGFEVTAEGHTVQATVPWWRDHDIESGRDLVEEVARVYGYTNIKPQFPAGLATHALAADLRWERRLRDVVSGVGWTETYTYSFVPRSLFELSGFDPSRMLRVRNPLTADFEFMRTSLIPSLLQVVADNQERKPILHLFEIAHVYFGHAANELPTEQSQLTAMVMNPQNVWREAKGLAERVLSEMGFMKIEWKRLETDRLWHPGR